MFRPRRADGNQAGFKSEVSTKGLSVVGSEFSARGGFLRSGPAL